MELMQRTRTNALRRPGRLRAVLFVVGCVVASASAAGALFSTSLSQSDTFVAGSISPATGFAARSVSATSAQLVWSAPLNFTPTNWTITQTSPAGPVSGSCSGNEPTSPCSISGLTTGTTYTWTITYFEGGWKALASTSATPTSVSSSLHGTYTLSVPARVTSFTYSMNGADGGGGDASGNPGSGGATVNGYITIPRSNNPTYFTVVVGGGGGAGDIVNGGAGGAGGTGCAGGSAGAMAGANNAGGGGGGAMTCLYLQGSPATQIVDIGGGAGGDGSGSSGPGTGGAPGGPTYTAGTATYIVSVINYASGPGAGGNAGSGGAPGSVVFTGDGLALS